MRAVGLQEECTFVSITEIMPAVTRMLFVAYVETCDYLQEWETSAPEQREIRPAAGTVARSQRPQGVMNVVRCRSSGWSGTAW